MISPTIITDCATEAVSLDELKGQCRLQLADTSQDAMLSIYRAAARQYVEGRKGWTIHEKTLEWVMQNWPRENYIILPRATPLIEVLSLKYRDSAGADTTMPTTDYIEDTDEIPGRIVLAYGNMAWPSSILYPASAIRIRYRAGIELTSPVSGVECPAELKIPILMLAGALFENREAVVVADQASVAQIAVDYGVEAFLAGNVAQYVF
jgi:uncharacterized phiE125 gp8 family phage protein